MKYKISVSALEKVEFGVIKCLKTEYIDCDNVFDAIEIADSIKKTAFLEDKFSRKECSVVKCF
jgi:hypothetical protein